MFEGGEQFRFLDELARQFLAVRAVGGIEHLDGHRRAGARTLRLRRLSIAL